MTGTLVVRVVNLQLVKRVVRQIVGPGCICLVGVPFRDRMIVVGENDVPASGIVVPRASVNTGTDAYARIVQHV